MVEGPLLTSDVGHKSSLRQFNKSVFRTNGDYKGQSLKDRILGMERGTDIY